MKKAENLVGKKFGRLTVIERAPNDVSPGGVQKVVWKCLCECGNEVNVRAYCLKSGVTKSCGCLHKESFEQVREKYRYKHGGAKHGQAKEKLYFTWLNMRKRCENISDKNYNNYGGRGISICEEWSDYTNFREWALKSGFNPNASSDEMTLDRIDVNGNYGPSNCRWVNRKVQNNNRRNNRFITYNNQTLTLSQWAEILQMDASTLKYRLDNWGVERSIETPLRVR